MYCTCIYQYTCMSILVYIYVISRTAKSVSRSYFSQFNFCCVVGCTFSPSRARTLGVQKQNARTAIRDARTHGTEQTGGLHHSSLPEQICHMALEAAHLRRLCASEVAMRRDPGKRRTMPVTPFRRLSRPLPQRRLVRLRTCISTRNLPR